MNFNEDDEQKLINFLNMVANHAEFNMKTNELIEYFKLLAHMQKEILPKLKANILEVKRVVEAPEDSQESEASEESKEK